MNAARRTFLAQFAAITTSLGSGAALAAKPLAGRAPAGMRLGLVTYNWGKDWDLATLLKHCEQTSFEGVELRSTHKHGVEITLTPRERREVALRFADSPVELVGLGSACEYHSPDPKVLNKNIEETKAFIRLCHDLGGSGVKVRPNGLPQDVPVPKTLEQIGNTLQDLGAFAADHGVLLRLEVHGRGTAHVPHIKTIMDHASHPAVTVCWNCNPQDLEGEGLAANFRLLEKRLGTVHIHDLSQPAYPWKELFGLLKGAGFQGWTLLEDGKVPGDIPAAMRDNRRIWEQLTA